MFESFGFEETTAKEISVLLGLALGLLFGLLAEATRFCLRRALIGTDRVQARGVWLAALATAVLGTQAAVSAGLISFDEHRYLAADLPILAIIVGGALFGIGMVLTRGCVSRLTVLGGSGNLRALLVLVVFAIVAHATLKGVLAPVRTTLGATTVNLGDYAALGALPGGSWLCAGALGVVALLVALRSGNSAAALIGGVAIGLLVPLAWVGTGYVLFDEFDPIAMESLSFTSPAADSLFYTIASTSISAGFGIGLLGGVAGGALIGSLIGGRFQWQSFETPRQTGRYMSGAVLMGIGGVLAGGCSVGAGLSGVATLGVSAVLALVSIALGALAAHAVLSRATFESAGSPTTPAPQPAE